MLASSCGINTHLPASRLESPETHGRSLAAGVDFGVQGSNSLSLTPGYDTTPVNTDMPSYSRTFADMTLGADMGLAERFDIGIETAFDSPLQLKGKFQLIGDPQVKARKGNLSLAVTAAIGGSTQNERSTGLFDDLVDAYEMRHSMADGSVIAGYRFADAVLVFGGPFVQKHWIDGWQVMDDGPEVPFELEAHQYGVNVGVSFMLSKTYQLMFEAVVVESHANDAHIRSGFLGGHLALVRF